MTLCILFVLFSWTFQAQTASKINVKSKVSTQNGEPLKGVLISCEVDEVSTLTDEKGSFILEVPSDTNLTVSKEGYETLIMKQPNNHKGNKSFLPSKDCIVCGKPFTWRKKWEKCWDEVKYCSDRCRKAKP